MPRTALFAALLLTASPVLAGPYAGLQVGATDRETLFAIGGPGGVFESEDSSTAPDFAAMVGYDFDALPFVSIAAELEAGLSTGKLTLDDIPGYRAEFKNRFNYMASLRPGISVGPGFTLYGIVGYGQNRVKASATSTGTVLPAGNFRDSYSAGGSVFGAGVRLNLPVAPFLRLEYRRRDQDKAKSVNQVMLGGGWRF